MVFNRFQWMLLLRVSLLALMLFALGLALQYPALYTVKILCGLGAILMVYDIQRFLGKGHRAVSEFLAGLQAGDFSLRAQSDSDVPASTEIAAALNQTRERLHDSLVQQQARLNYLQALTEHSPIALLSVGTEGELRLHNIAARQLFAGVEPCRLDELADFGEALVNVLRHPQAEQKHLVDVLIDGEVRQFVVRMAEVSRESQHEWIVSLQDIQRELDETQMQTWEELVSVLTHEIMNSITPVTSLSRSAADLLSHWQAQLDAGEGGDTGEWVQRLDRALSTVARRSESLADFVQRYRSISSAPQPARSRFALKPLCESLCKLLQAEADSNILIELRVEPDELVLDADPGMLEQILLNLLKNSCEALRDASVAQPAIELRAWSGDDGRVRIAVSDNGPGIPADQRRQVFMPFFSSKREGSGVGLALARQLMLAHNGSISVAESDSGGARFCLKF